jgi:GDP-4-dehydro-6-deoxy-D-mannose reductase
MKSALIIGGTGFVGQHLARQLSDRYRVTTTGRTDDVRDPAAMRRVVSRTHPEIVVNLASLTTVRETIERPREAYEVAFFGTFNLLEALQDDGFTGRFVQVSSSEVYGYPPPESLPLNETAPLRPKSPYAVAKVMSEVLCSQWNDSGRFGIVIARPFTHIGPGQSDRFAVASFARQIAEISLRRRPPVLRAGNLSATRDLTDVRDIVRAYDALIHHGRIGQVYNVCSGREVRMHEVVEQMIALSDMPIELVTDDALRRTAEQQRLCGSYDALHNDTGWEPNIPLSLTLSETMQEARRTMSDSVEPASCRSVPQPPPATSKPTERPSWVEPQ